MMTTNIQKYKHYKNSGVEWLGDVPTSWEYIRMKYLFKDVSEKNKPNEELLSVTQNQGVVPRTWVKNRMVMPSSNLESFKFIKKGDFAISLRSFEGGLEYCHHDGIISPAYTVLKKKRNFDDDFYKFLFKSHAFISELQTSVVGIREGKNISYPELSYSFLPIPPKPEQTKIANFLDRKTAQIDEAIAQKEQLIELLKERQQTVIDRVLKHPSKVEIKNNRFKPWDFELPITWNRKKLKYLCWMKGRLGWQNLRSDEYKQQGPLLVSSEHFKNDKVNWTKCKHVTIERFLMAPEIILKPNDVLFMKDGAGMGKLAFIENIDFQACLNSHLLLLRPNEEFISPKFLFYILKSKIFYAYMCQERKGSTFFGFSQRAMGNYEISYPNVKEQQKIVNHIETQTQKIKKAITLKTQEITKLKEYKTVLIDAAVTGKVLID